MKDIWVFKLAWKLYLLNVSSFLPFISKIYRLTMLISHWLETNDTLHMFRGMVLYDYIFQVEPNHFKYQKKTDSNLDLSLSST